MPRAQRPRHRWILPMTNPNFPASPRYSDESDSGEEVAPSLRLVFNANDPSGAGGLSADVTAIASVGAHPLPIVTGAYVRDTAEIVDHFAIRRRGRGRAGPHHSGRRAGAGDQGRVCGLDPENLSAIAEIATDYADIPLIAYMPDLSWWEEDKIDLYQDAFRELLLPQTTLLVGNHSTCGAGCCPTGAVTAAPRPRHRQGRCQVRRALHPGHRHPAARPVHRQRAGVAQAVLCSEKFERFDAVFSGAGDTLSAALAALIATGTTWPTPPPRP
jgi:hydroxymethylpyrimidine/phosphomethylpyrimidine kinase